MVKRQVTVSDQGSYKKLDAPSLPRTSWQVTDKYVAALVKLSMSDENLNSRVKLSPFSF
jgi:hypothetical protein